jgi:hypothetical protein
VRFEALVRNPEQSLRAICATLSVPFEHAMLSLQAGRDMKPGLGDPNFSSHLSIDAARANEWKGRYRESSLAVSTRQLMQRLDLGASEA